MKSCCRAASDFSSVNVVVDCIDLGIRRYRCLYHHQQIIQVLYPCLFIYCFFLVVGEILSIVNYEIMKFITTVKTIGTVQHVKD